MKPIDLPGRFISSCLLSILLAAAAVGPAHAQSIVREWARVFDSGGIDRASEIDVTPAGDVYVVGTAGSRDTTRLLLLHYAQNGALLWSTKMASRIQTWVPPLLCVDPTGRAVVAGTDWNDIPHLDGGFVARVRVDGDSLWTRYLGTSVYPKALSTDGANRIHVAYDLDYGPLMPGAAVVSLDGDVLCSRFELTLGHSPDRMLVSPGTVLVVGGDGYYNSSALAMSAFDNSCQLTWLSKVGLGGAAHGVSVVQLYFTVFIGNIEVRGAYDVWLGCYSFYPGYVPDADEFLTFDMAGGNDKAAAAAANGELAALTGSAEGASLDVLVGRFSGCGGGSWWTYNGPTGGDDQGVDIGFLPSGEIVVLAQVAGDLDNDQALLLYTPDGQLLDVDIDTFIDNPVGLAITSTGEIYTTSYNAGDARVGAGNIIVNKYSISPGVGIASAEAPGRLRVGSPEPNPSMGSVTISYELPTAGEVRAGVYDASGWLVRMLQAGHQESGTHEIVWDGLTETGRPAASGAYFVRFDLGNRVERRRVVLTR